MAATAKKTNPKLWERVKAKVTRDAKGGRPGQWSARKAQMAVHDYKAAGGTYAGPKSADNHLTQWSEKDAAKRKHVGKTRAELYAAAQRAQIPGRSRMRRDELERALRAKR
jgi:protein involved in polysaccharide export with SLBB domain